MTELIFDDLTPIATPDLNAGFRGLIPRDPITHGVGYAAAIPPAEIELIPRADWSRLIKEGEAAQSFLSHIRDRGNAGAQIPSLDQNGQGYSHHADTEVLTDKGFVPWPEYNGIDLLGSVNQVTGLMEFQSPSERHAYEYNDEMVYSVNRRLDFGVTGNHRMLVRKWDEKQRTLAFRYTMQRADELGWYVGMMHAPSGWMGTEFVELEVPGDRRYDGDDFLALVALLCSDGFAGGSDTTTGLVSFCCFNEQRYPAVAALAARVGFDEQLSRRGVWNRHSAHALAAWVRTHCYTGPELGASRKAVPLLVKCASMRQIGFFLRSFGDQTHGAETAQFFSASKRMIDDLQELHLRIGKRGSIGRCPARQSIIKSGDSIGKIINGGESFVLTIGKEDCLCIDKKKHIEQDRYKGLVYCATVPNGTLITRRNGSILISGNCWAYGTTNAMMLLRAKANQPYVRLSGHAVGCKVKGFRDEGGWGALSLDFITKNGVPSVQAWPEKSMNRSNDTAATWEDAAKYKPDEGFVDLASPNYDRNLTFDQVITLLLRRTPVVCDFDWWGHCVVACDPVETSPGQFGVRIWNSWGDSWSAKGMGVLVGNKAVPNNAVAPTTAAA